MDQITITREEFREKIIKNPERYGIVRAMRKDPEKTKGHEMQAFLEELTLLTLKMAFREIEMDLFGPEE